MTLPTKSLLTVLLTTSLLISGCKGQNAPELGEISTDVANMTVKSITKKEIEDLLKVKPRKVSPENSQEALERLGFEKGKSGFTWKGNSDSNGTYSYTDLTTKTDNGETVTIGKLDFVGVRTEGESAILDRLDLYNIRVEDTDKAATIETMSLVKPTAELASGIMDALENVEKLKDLDDLDFDMDIDEDEIGFGAFKLSGLKINDEDATLNLDYMGWAEDEKTGKALFLIDNIDLLAEDPQTKMPITFNLDSVSASGLDMEHFRRSRSDGQQDSLMGRAGSLGNTAQAFNPYAKTFDTFALKNLSLDVDTFSMETEGITGKANRKGKVTTIQQNIKPLSIGFSADPKNRDLQELKDLLAELELDNLALSTNQTTVMDEGTDTVTVKDATVRLHDVFTINYDYKGSGLKHLQLDNTENMSAVDVQNMMEKLNLVYLNLAISDESFVDKAFSYAAKKQGSSPRLVRMQAKGALALASFGAKNEAQGDAISKVSQALGSFMDDGGTIKISLNPEQPIPVSRLQDMDPTQLDPAEFGFSISHEN